MKTLFIVLGFIFTSITLAADDGIWVDGFGAVKVAPDIANFSFTVSTIDMSARKSQSQNAKITKDVLSKLKSLGVAGKDIQSSGFNLHAEYDYRNSKRMLKGHRVTHSFQTVIRNVANLGEILDSLTSVGSDALAIGGISFGIDNDSSLKLKSLESSVENAQIKAQVLAKAAGQKLGEVLAIEEVSSSSGVPVMRMKMMESASMSNTPTSVEGGEVGVTSKVRVHFKLN